METLVYKPINVCSREYTITHENGVIVDIKVVGGCVGNLTGICHLLKGMEIKKAIPLLEGIKCPGSRTKQTSCPDQISLALKSIQ